MLIIAMIEIILQTASTYVCQHKGRLDFLITKANNDISFVVRYSLRPADARPPKIHEIFAHTLSQHSTYDTKNLKELITTSQDIELLSSYKDGFLVQEILINNGES